MKKVLMFLSMLMIVFRVYGSANAIPYTFTSLDYPGATSTAVRGIDGSNIVGEYGNSSGVYGFLYDVTTWSTLYYPGAIWVLASGIDGSNIVGGYQDASWMYHGFLYDGTIWSTLDYPGATSTRASGIDGNNIVGEYRDANWDHGFLYDGTTWSTLDYPGAYGTYATGISGSNIVGWYRDANGDHGFFYDGTTWSTLDYPGAYRTYGAGISGSNIVGWYQDANGDHGFFYDGTVWTSLDYPSAFMTAAFDIEGGNIAGVYWDDSGNHGFLATPLGSIITVCPSGCDYITIQSAINAASNGFTVVVSPGTYIENINFTGKAITVRSEKGASQTIINGGGVGSVVTFGSGEGNNSVLDGFTITGGSATQGGGIYIHNSSPVIKNNIITGNSAVISGGQWDGYGGGIRAGLSSAIITNNTITGNTASTGGGGIRANSSNLTITNTILYGNGTEISVGGTGTTTVSYSIVQGGYTGTGNIDADPLFVDPLNGDYNLQSGSPAIDTGMNSSAPAYGSVVDDIIGTLRPQDGDGLGAGTTGDGSDYDIGAYEYILSAPTTYTLTITKADTGSGTVTSSPAGIDCGADCSEAYNSNTSVTLTPTPDAGSFFTGWSGDADCSDGIVTVDANKTCTALFTLNAYNLNVTINPSSGGVVTAPGINCPGDCTESYNYGNNITLTATANTGYTFNNWTNCDSPSGNQCTMTMNSDKDVTANFTSMYQYTLSISKGGNGIGTVTSSPAGINCGADCYELYDANITVTLTPVPDTGSTFSYWSGDADCSDGVVTADVSKTCWAIFNKPILTVTKSGTGTGTVTSSPAGINCGADCSETYNLSTTVTLTPIPDAGSVFSYWRGDADCSDGVVTMDVSKSCGAVFERPVFGLAISKGGNGTGTVTSSPAGINCGADCYELYDANITVTLTATPDSGSTFSYWSGDADCSDGVVTADVSKTCWAVFNKPILTVTKSGDGTGTVTSSPAGINCSADCSETYNLSTTVTLTPIPDAGSVFSYWRGDADCSDGVVTMDVSKSCGAVFERPVFGLAISKGGNGAGTVTTIPAGINCGADCYELYDANITVTLTATPDSGSTFSYWSGDNDCSDGVVTADVSKTCWAVFALTP